MDPTGIQAEAPPLGPSVNVAARGHQPASTADPAPPGRTARPLWRRTFEVLASLRLTVVLFVLSLIVVFYGTIAQKEIGTWPAVGEYFRCFVAKVPLEVLCVYGNYAQKLFNPDVKEPLFQFPDLWVPLPGGWLLGTLLMVNLLAAHAVRFKLRWDRVGVLVLHAGLILLMVGEVITGLYQVEGYMSIEKGKSSNYIIHRDTMELALTRTVDPKHDQIVAFRSPLLQDGATLDDAALPFEIHIEQYLPNAKLQRVEPGTPNPATAGSGLQATPVAVPSVRGLNDVMDHPAAYVRLLDRATGAALGTYLVSLRLHPQEVTVGGSKYEMALRLKRSYRPYTFHLDDFQSKPHVGTNRASDYRSFIHLSNPETGEDRKVQIYMNHPLRYRGETFYQHMPETFDEKPGSVLQVVRNPGWTLPYIACTVVCIGMLIHFGQNLVRFLERRAA